MSEASALVEPVVTVQPPDGQPRLHGLRMEKLPDDLYIPPDALQVFMAAFEGPLDLLLYLIRRQNLDILDIPVFAITQQYVKYIELMTDLRLELAAEYLVMAALLAEIKSRILLPKLAKHDAVEDDPRMDLVRRLQEYERYKTAAETLDSLPRMGRELHPAAARPEQVRIDRPLPQPTLRELLMAFREVLHRAQLYSKHQVTHEPLSVRARMTSVLARVRTGRCELIDLVDLREGKAGVVVVLLAILELTKLAMLEVIQAQAFAPLYLQAAAPRNDTAEADGIKAASFD